jgi:hypothetical protein
MAAALGISLYSYFYLKLIKTVRLFNKIREQKGRTGSAQTQGRGDCPKQCINVSKCKNDKINA